MGMPHLSQDQVDDFLKSLGNWRVERTQEVGGRLGVYELALALRETHAKNIDGGAVWDAAKGEWVFAPLDSGIGCTQDDGAVRQVRHVVALHPRPHSCRGRVLPAL
jgi:hypothetical protein